MQGKKSRKTEDDAESTECCKNPGQTSYSVDRQGKPVENQGHAKRIAQKAVKEGLSC